MFVKILMEGHVQVVNHEIPQPVLDDALRAARECFEMTPKEKQAYNMELETPYESGYSIQSLESKDKVLDWGDVMFHKNMEKWPTKPANYKSVSPSFEYLLSSPPLPSYDHC